MSFTLRWCLMKVYVYYYISITSVFFLVRIQELLHSQQPQRPPPVCNSSCIRPWNIDSLLLLKEGSY